MRTRSNLNYSPVKSSKKKCKKSHNMKLSHNKQKSYHIISKTKKQKIVNKHETRLYNNNFQSEIYDEIKGYNPKFLKRMIKLNKLKNKWQDLVSQKKELFKNIHKINTKKREKQKSYDIARKEMLTYLTMKFGPAISKHYIKTIETENSRK